MKNYLVFLTLSIFGLSFSQEKTNVILIGTFHFNNPGYDAIKMKDRNILDGENQKSLEAITSKIVKKYKPDQIFVEELLSNKSKLNNEYNQYLRGNFKSVYDTIKDSQQRKRYLENEVYQFGFRLAKKANNKEIYPIDDIIEFRYDILMQEISKDAKLKDEFRKIMDESSQKINKCISEDSLKNVFLCLNTDDSRIGNKGMYIWLNKIGIDEDFYGSELVTGWYKRNLRMYSAFQNQLKPTSKNVVILVGNGHSAMLYDFIKNDKNLNLIEVAEALK